MYEALTRQDVPIKVEDWKGIMRQGSRDRGRLTIIGHTLALFPREYSGWFSIPRISTFSGGIFNSSYVSRNAVVVIDSSSYSISRLIPVHSRGCILTGSTLPPGKLTRQLPSFLFSPPRGEVTCLISPA